MNSSHLLNSGIVYSFNGTYPQLYIRIHRIFNHHRDINTPEAVGNILHCKRIGRGTGPDPDDIHSIFQGFIHMFHIGYLGGYQHPGLLLYGL